MIGHALSQDVHCLPAEELPNNPFYPGDVQMVEPAAPHHTVRSPPSAALPWCTQVRPETSPSRHPTPGYPLLALPIFGGGIDTVPACKPHGQGQDSQEGPPAPGPAAAAAAPPSWPPFKPALPVATLDLDFPVPALADNIALVRHFWPRSLCRVYVGFLESLPLTLTPGRPKRGEAVRVNDRFQVQDPAFAQRLWRETGIQDVVLGEAARHLWGGEVIGLNPNIRVYRYCKGHFFDAHYDDANLVSLKADNTSEVAGKTTWTMLLYLTDDCVGGETVFYPHDRELEKEAVVIAPEAGMLLLHKHGNDCLLHAGREVVQGVKWILRTDLVVRK
ncbi:2OG-Fe(II) oxygenase [Microdochium nivale]|nr:2OG-Fe(II) oxygenase [Microdochium nivale]